MSDTKTNPVSVGWTVVTGPDRSHLIDVQLFCRLRDANRHFDAIPNKPRQLWRHEWRHPFVAKGKARLLREAYP